MPRLEARELLSGQAAHDEDIKALYEWEQATSSLAALRQRALRHVLADEKLQELYSVDTIRAAAHSFNQRTSTGADSLPISVIASLPDEALQELAEIFKTMRKQVAPPVQQLIVLLATIPKKLEGVRSIALLPAVFRVFTQLSNPEFKWWDEVTALSGDTKDSAAPGANARDIAVERQLKAELARIRGRRYAQLLWDVNGVL